MCLCVCVFVCGLSVSVFVCVCACVWVSEFVSFNFGLCNESKLSWLLPWLLLLLVRIVQGWESYIYV